MRYPLATHSSIRLSRVSDLPSLAMDWLWDGWLPLGEMVILDGDPGIGKSLVALDLCARLTAGRPWPDGAALGGPGNVVVLSAEDNMQRTVRPRLLALGANVDRVYSLDGVVDSKGDEPIRLPAHALVLREVLRKTQAKLVVLDPLVAYLDRSVATHNDQSVRAALGVLAALAAEHQCAVILVRHLNKNQQQRALYRGGGSIGFLAAVRCAWLIAADPQQPGQRVLAQNKNNLLPSRSSLSFQIRGTPPTELEVAWLGQTRYHCDQLLEHKRGRGRPATRRERAEQYLKLFMQERPRTLDEVREFAKDQKISERTLERIKQGLGIRSVRAPRGERRATYWLLPGQLPENTSEEMLTPMETREQEMSAAQEEMDEIMADLRRKWCSPEAEAAAAAKKAAEAAAAASAPEGPRPENVVGAPVVAEAQAAREPPIPAPRAEAADLSVAEPAVPVIPLPEPVPSAEASKAVSANLAAAPVVATQAASERRVSEPARVIPCEGGTVGRSAALPVVSPAAPVVVESEPVRPTPTPEPVGGSLAAPPFVLSPIAVPTKEEKERAAELERERRRWRRWP